MVLPGLIIWSWSKPCTLGEHSMKGTTFVSQWATKGIKIVWSLCINPHDNVLVDCGVQSWTLLWIKIGKKCKLLVCAFRTSNRIVHLNHQSCNLKVLHCESGGFSKEKGCKNHPNRSQQDPICGYINAAGGRDKHQTGMSLFHRCQWCKCFTQIVYHETVPCKQS